MAESSGEGDLPNEQAVAGRWSMLRSELNQLYSKITELELELSEHSLVISAIQPLDPARKCFRMIGGVLVERTVGEVLPAVQRNRDGLQDVIAKLGEALQRKKKELADFESKYKIKIRRSDEPVGKDSREAPSSAQGVLVGPSS